MIFHRPDGPGLQELLGVRSQKRLGRIFSKCIFLNLLDLKEVPMVVRATAQTKILTTTRLGCDIVPKVLAHQLGEASCQFIEVECSFFSVAGQSDN